MSRAIATFTRPASATQYTSGDHIANSGTGSLVTPMEFTTVVSPTGMVIEAACTVKPESGDLVITALDFDLLLFAPLADIPFAAGSFPADNAALTLTNSMYHQLVAVLNFSAGNWRNPLGALTAGATGWQPSVSAVRPMAMYDSYGLSKLIGVVQAKSAWNPGNIAQAFHFSLGYSFK